MTPDEIEKDRAPEKILRDWEAQARDMDARNPMRSQILEEASIIRSDIALLTAERDAALALVAAAYEAASDYAWSACIMCGDTDARAIRALTPADALAAQAARDERMRAKGAREAEARIARLAAALKHLDHAATEVIRYGAQTGPQWTRITAASLKARVALKENSNEQLNLF